MFLSHHGVLVGKTAFEYMICFWHIDVWRVFWYLHDTLLNMIHFYYSYYHYSTFQNTHHFLKYSPDTMGILQVWCMALFCLGSVVYPLSLAMWIENGNNDSYYYINTGCCFIMMIFNIVTPIDDNANDLFKLYHKAAPSTAFVFYSVATILNWQGVEGSQYMLYVAPFCFVMVCYTVFVCLVI